MIVLYVIFFLAIVQGVISLLQGFRAARHIETFRPELGWRPKVTVFCPCKGIDPEFDLNVKSILDQDYPGLNVVFIVESTTDPAYGALQSMSERVLVAGPSTRRGQKVHNLLHGVENAPADVEVFVFCDDDARFPRDWVANLIAPLKDDGVAVSTGYRWYAPGSGSVPALLRSIWNASAVTMLGAHSKNFVWGGSMALRRETFDRIGVRQAWDGAVSDDYAVTLSARKAGLGIVFVPQCLVPSYGDCSWSELLEFTTRQIVITRVYEPGMWRMAFFSQTLFNVAFWSSLVVFWPVCLVLYILAVIKSYVRYEAVKKVLPVRALSKHRASYILFSPLIALLYEYNLVRSALTRDILWRQIRYSLISPTRTIVCRCADES